MFSRNSTICGLNKGCGLFDPHPLISPSNAPPPATTLGTFLLEAKRMLISPPAFSLSLENSRSVVTAALWYRVEQLRTIIHRKLTGVFFFFGGG